MEGCPFFQTELKKAYIEGSMCPTYAMLVAHCSVQFSPSVMSDSLQPHGLQHARLPVHHQLPEPAQIHTHQVSDAIQQSHSLSSPSPPTFNLPSIRVFSSESVLHINGQRIGVSFRLQHQSFQWTPGTDLEWTGWISLQSKGSSRVFSNTTVEKHQFFCAQLSVLHKNRPSDQSR